LFKRGSGCSDLSYSKRQNIDPESVYSKAAGQDDAGLAASTISYIPANRKQE
jgi:hypothetical protein